MKQMEYASPVGRITLVSDGGALIGAWIEGQKYFAATLQEEPENDPEEPVLRQAAAWLDAYFAGKKPAVSDLPLQPRGSAFRQEVWRLLCEIPYGETVTSGELADKIAAARGMK
ncbi:MAG: methylated-DNA--[Solobacterium sp.]|nr:methylated-DNA--[protein]-cysteine S-methyltransferase [Solobacterium sp.]